MGSATATPTAVQSSTEPIQIGRIGLFKPAVVPPEDDATTDRPDDSTRLAKAYTAAAPPPGADGRGKGITVNLVISDLSRSIAFYQDVLGFRQRDRGRGAATLEFGNGRVLLSEVRGTEPKQRLVQMLLEVPDIDAAYSDLLAHGLTFLHRPRRVAQYEGLELLAAAFRAPDGHGIAIAEWREI
jgi:catechol 2,3-dioxygenase-like lactoylglutathione lyase family enzyme